MRLLAALTVFFLHVTAASAELVNDPIVLSFCRDLAKRSVSERSREHGAFVVRTAEGILYFVAWPPGEEKDVLRWYGRFPEGTLAILHTHPAWQPAASNLDRRTARRTGIPVYVVTTSSISKTIGGPSEVVMTGDWTRRRLVSSETNAAGPQ